MEYLRSSFPRYVEIFSRFLFLQELQEHRPFLVFILLVLLLYLLVLPALHLHHLHLGASIRHSLLGYLENLQVLFYRSISMNILLRPGLDILLCLGIRMYMLNSSRFLV